MITARHDVQITSVGRPATDLFSFTGINAETFSLNEKGLAGNVTITAERVLMENGGLISATTKGAGDAGHIQITAGLLPPGDLTSAESTLASRQLAVVQAELNVEAAWDALRAVLNLPRDQWSKPILPTEAPSFAEQAVTAEDALQLAIANRPELAQAKLDIASQDLNVRQADNNRLPEVDVGLSGGLIGQDSTYGGALREYGRADATTWAMFLNLTWTPLQRATRAAAEIEREHAKLTAFKRDQTLQDVWAAVRDAVRTQTGAARQVFAASKFRDLSAKNLEIEQRKFLTGQTSNFVIAQRQEELAQAQLAELQAVVAHKKAQAALLRATGRLLDERGVKLH